MATNFGAGKADAGAHVPGSTAAANHVPSNKDEVHRLELEWRKGKRG